MHQKYNATPSQKDPLSRWKDRLAILEEGHRIIITYLPHFRDTPDYQIQREYNVLQDLLADIESSKQQIGAYLSDCLTGKNTIKTPYPTENTLLNGINVLQYHSSKISVYLHNQKEVKKRAPQRRERGKFSESTPPDNSNPRNIDKAVLKQLKALHTAIQENLYPSV